ncbi:MAG: tetratricopeptide repeat protein, partial [Thermoleophilia bacterium]|nr:tetratricopeptide repeat protein [Thermoleophilia bacterium]
MVVLALLIRAVASNPEPLDTWGQEPLLAAVTGITPERLQSSQEEWAQILPRVEQLVSKSPDDVNLQRKLALAYYNLGRLAEAKTIYEQLLAKQEDPVLRNRLGNTLRDMGDIAGAEAAYRKAMADNPALGPLLQATRNLS